MAPTLRPHLRPRLHRRLIVGVDGSDGSKDALRWAAQLAGSLGAQLDAIATWDMPMVSMWSLLPASYSPQADIERLLEQTVTDVFGADRPEGMRVKVLEGPAAELLIEVSRHALMVVVGNRGFGGFAGVLLGSVSSRVAEHAACPVLVARGTPPG